MGENSNQGIADRQAITEVVQSWALYRDTGDWDGLRSTVHPDAVMTATWFEGLFEAFIEAAQASWRRGSRSQHFLGGTVVEIRGERAIAQTRMAIMVRGMLDGTEVDVNCVGRFYDRVERRDGRWRIARRAVVYEKDRMDPVNPDVTLNLDTALLARFPDGYRHLAYLQSASGAQVNPNLATARGEALDGLIAAARDWLVPA